METKNLIEASATIVTVTRMERGSVYKRVETGDYRGTRLVYGVVTSVMHNGSDGAITASEFDVSVHGAEAKEVVHTTASDLAIYTATPEEVEGFLGRLVERVLSERETARETLAKVEARVQVVNSFAALTDRDGQALVLVAPETSTREVSA